MACGFTGKLPGTLGAPGSLLQDAANVTLRSETLRETMCDAIIANGGVKKPSKKVQNVCDHGCRKHGSDFSCVCDAGHTVQFN